PGSRARGSRARGGRAVQAIEGRTQGRDQTIALTHDEDVTVTAGAVLHVDALLAQAEPAEDGLVVAQAAAAGAQHRRSHGVRRCLVVEESLPVGFGVLSVLAGALGRVEEVIEGVRGLPSAQKASSQQPQLPSEPSSLVLPGPAEEADDPVPEMDQERREPAR